jgi:hypothetical protein
MQTQLVKIFENQVAELFKDKPLAYEFLCLYGQYCAAIDDIIDERETIKFTREASKLACRAFSTAYWRQYSNILFITDRIIHNDYFDSVRMCSSDKQWEKDRGKVYANAGMMMTQAVILIEFGEDKLSEYSLLLKEFAYERHKDDQT